MAFGLVSAILAPAHANPALFEEAKKHIAAMNPKQAYMLLIAQQDKLTGNTEFDYLLGVAALDSGKIDEAIIAFERVLAVQPNNAGAQLDLARAYFNAGSLDLSESTFRKLRALNPPANAMLAIDKYLAAIVERRRASKRLLSVWGETALGYDSNLTAVPNDFTTAIQQAFNIPGVRPTGNSLKRKAPFLGAGIGADTILPLGDKWSVYLGGDIRGRGFRAEGEFNSGVADVRASAIWTEGKHQLRLNTAYNVFDQDGDAPGSPPPTNDRRAASAGTEWRLNLTASNQLSLGLAASQVRFPSNNTEDFNATILQATWLTVFATPSQPMLQLAAFGSRDKAVRKFADGVTDKSKKVAGFRVYTQVNRGEALSLFASTGLGSRRDDSAFARATTVQFGRDKLIDVSLGVNWRFQERCNMRAQWMGSRADSNIAIYDYTRHEVSSTIRCEFF